MLPLDLDDGRNDTHKGHKMQTGFISSSCIFPFIILFSSKGPKGKAWCCFAQSMEEKCHHFIDKLFPTDPVVREAVSLKFRLLDIPQQNPVFNLHFTRHPLFPARDDIGPVTFDLRLCKCLIPSLFRVPRVFGVCVRDATTPFKLLRWIYGFWTSGKKFFSCGFPGNKVL